MPPTASHYQIMPLGVVDAAIDRRSRTGDRDLPGRGRGGDGTRRRLVAGGQTVNSSVIVDCSTHLNRILDLDVTGRRARVEPGIVLDDLNRALKPHGLWFPVGRLDASRATIGGIDGEQLLRADARSLWQHPRERHLDRRHAGRRLERRISVRWRRTFPTCRRIRRSVRWRAICLRLGAREADEMRRGPKVQRRVGGYNIDALCRDGTTSISRTFWSAPKARWRFHRDRDQAVAGARQTRGRRLPTSAAFTRRWRRRSTSSSWRRSRWRLIDATMIGLAREIDMFRPTLDAFVRGAPAALLLVEFAEEPDENARRLKRLHELMGDLGFNWRMAAPFGAASSMYSTRSSRRRSPSCAPPASNIMMSMKEAGKPISFVEDCAVPLEHLADYTSRLTEVFERNAPPAPGTPTPSVGLPGMCGPILNLRSTTTSRRCATSPSRPSPSSANTRARTPANMATDRALGVPRVHVRPAARFAPSRRSRTAFDPDGLYNPGKIVRAPKFDDPNELPLRAGLFTPTN